MKRAARASPADPARRPSIESCARASRRLVVRSTVATGGLAADVDGEGLPEHAAHRVTATMRRRDMTQGNNGWRMADIGCRDTDNIKLPSRTPTVSRVRR